MLYLSIGVAAVEGSAIESSILSKELVVIAGQHIRITHKGGPVDLCPQNFVRVESCGMNPLSSAHARWWNGPLYSCLKNPGLAESGRMTEMSSAHARTR